MSDQGRTGMYYPLPDNLIVTKTRCVQMEIPDDDQYFDLLRGALLDLTKWYKYQRDSSHSGRLVASNWWVAYDTLTKCKVCPPPFLESEYDMSLCEQMRWQDGKLQLLCCGEWQDVPGTPPPGLTGGNQQPASGTVAVGDCMEFDVVLQANNQWYSPVPVGGNFSIEITAASGGWSDGSINWKCPDGTPYVLGFCVGAPVYSGTDPAPSLPHMSLVAVANSVWYPASSGTINIPGADPSEPLIIQANDSNLTDNTGSVSFHVKICNKNAETVTHVFDFTTGMHGWYLTDDGAGTAAYVPGVGWKANNPSCNPGQGSMSVNSPVVGAFSVLSSEFDYTASAAASNPAGRNWAFFLSGSATNTGNLNNGSGAVVTNLGPTGANDKIGITLDCDTCPSNAVFTKFTITIAGTVDPWAGL